MGRRWFERQGMQESMEPVTRLHIRTCDRRPNFRRQLQMADRAAGIRRAWSMTDFMRATAAAIPMMTASETIL